MEHKRNTCDRRVAASAALAVIAGLVWAATVAIRAPVASALVPPSVPSVVDTNYAIPAGALFVSPSGSDSNTGTQSAPLATLKKAVALASKASTIVLRAGTYRESIPSIFRAVSIQAYPHEQVWLDGRQVVTTWTSAGSGWVHASWNPGLCQNCYNPATLQSSAPAAGLPDMVFVDGVGQGQVSSLSQLMPGTFFVDYSSHNLHLGSNPTGHLVEASVLSAALEFDTPGAAGSMLRGVGVIGYGSYWNPNPGMAMVVANAANITLENDTFAWSATRGVAVLAPGAVVRGDTFLYNGYQGLVANGASGLIIQSSRFAHSNQENFIYGWSAISGSAGAKITNSSNVVVEDSVFEDNTATGLWFDISSQNLTIVRNLFQRNLWDGVTIEISDSALVASNASVDNAGVGVDISGTTNTRIWNNTVANNGTAQVGVYEDARSNPNAQQRAAGITWDTANVALDNNILASDNGTATLALLQTLDGNSPKQVGATQMVSALDYSVYARASTLQVTDDDYWANLTAPLYADRYQAVRQFNAATGFEAAGVEFANYSASPLFVNEAMGDYHLQSGAPVHGTGLQLPSDIAAAIGVSQGGAVDRGAVSWATGTPKPILPPPTTLPGATTTTTTPAPVVTAVYGILSATGDRIYSTDLTEVNNDVAQGWTSLGVIFKADKTSGPGLSPVYRMKSPVGEHLYSGWTGERDRLVSAGWLIEGTAFYTPLGSGYGLIPIFRYFDTVNSHHYLSTSATVPASSQSDGTVFWAAP